MMRIDPGKRWILGLLAGAILVIFLLAIGLTGLKMNPGMLFGLGGRPATTFAAGDSSGWGWLVDVFRVVLALALIIFPFYLIYMLINPKRRRQLIRDVIIFALILFFFDQLRRISENLSNRDPSFEGVGPNSDLPPAPQITPLTDFVANPPPWLVTLVIITVVIVIALILFLIFWFTLRKRSNDADAITIVEQQAQDALQSINAGGDLRDTIIQCYRSMVQAVKNERGIHRELSVTPREFVKILTGKGLPPGPVRDLTRLFEDVRYGNVQGGMRQQIEAVSCLEEIVEACKRQKEAQ
jgi:hypothetical protein